MTAAPTLAPGTAPSAIAAFQRSGGGGTFDLDNDGNSDLVVANRGSDDVRVYYGDGDGTFDSKTASTLAVGDAPSDVEIDAGAASATDPVTSTSRTRWPTR